LDDVKGYFDSSADTLATKRTDPRPQLGCGSRWPQTVFGNSLQNGVFTKHITFSMVSLLGNILKNNYPPPSKIKINMLAFGIFYSKKNIE